MRTAVFLVLGWLLLGFLLAPGTAAQTVASATALVLHVTRPVDAAFVQRDLAIPWATGVACNQPPIAPPPPPWINVTRVDFNDPLQLAPRSCRLTASGLALSSAFFAALPTNAGYYLTVTLSSIAGDSAPSLASGPFERTAGTPCGVNLVGRQVTVRLSTGQVTLCVEPR